MPKLVIFLLDILRSGRRVRVRERERDDPWDEMTVNILSANTRLDIRALLPDMSANTGIIYIYTGKKYFSVHCWPPYICVCVYVYYRTEIWHIVLIKTFKTRLMHCLKIKVRPLYFLKLLKFQKIMYHHFINYWPLGQDIRACQILLKIQFS